MDDTSCPQTVLVVLVLVLVPINVWWTYKRHQIIRKSRAGILRRLEQDGRPHVLLATHSRLWGYSVLSAGVTWLEVEAIVTANSLTCFFRHRAPWLRPYSSMIQLQRESSKPLPLLPDLYVAGIDSIRVAKGDLVITFTDRKGSLRAPRMFGRPLAITGWCTLVLKSVAWRREFDLIKQLLNIEPVQ